MPNNRRHFLCMPLILYVSMLHRSMLSGVTGTLSLLSVCYSEFNFTFTPCRAFLPLALSLVYVSGHHSVRRACTSYAEDPRLLNVVLKCSRHLYIGVTYPLS